MANRMHGDNSVIIIHQSGRGTPTHISPKATMFFDIDDAVAYINKNGLSQWAQLVDTTMITGATFGTDTYVTGGTYNQSNGIATFTNNTGGTFSVGGFYTGATDVYVTGGTYNIGTGTATFVNNTGGTFSLFGFNSSTGNTSPTIVSYTYNQLNNTFTITDSTGNTFNATFTTVSGLTVNGTLSATTISATTFYGDGSNLTGLRDVFVTGSTYSNGTATFRNNTGGTFNVTGFYTGYTAPVDVFVTGGTYTAGVATFTNNTGGTFGVGGFFSGNTLYSGNGTLTGNRNVNTSGYSLTFSGTSAPNQLVLDSSGNILMGTSVDTGYKLDVNGSFRTQTGIRTESGGVFSFGDTSINNGNLSISRSDALPLANTISTSANNQPVSLILSNGNGSLGSKYSYIGFSNVETIPQRWDVGTYGTSRFTIYNQTSGTTALTITTTNNIILGSHVDSGYKFDVMGTARMSATTTPLTLIGVQTASDPNLLTIDSSGVVHTYTISALTVSVLTGVTASTPTLYSSNGSLSGNRVVNLNAKTLNFSSSTTPNALVINTTGNLLLGTTTDSGYKLDVLGTIRSTSGVSISQNSGNLVVGSSLNTGQVTLNLKQSTNLSLGWLFGYTSNAENSLYFYGSESNGSFYLYTNAQNRFEISSAGSVVFNQGALDADFRIESTGSANMFFVDASTNRIGVRNPAPAYTLDVIGNVKISATTNPLTISGVTTANDPNLLTIDSSGVVHTYAISALTVSVLTGVTASTPTLYSSNGSLSGNRVVNIGTNTLNFSSSTYNNLLMLNTGGVLIGTSTNSGYKLDVNGTVRMSATTNPLTIVGLQSGVGTDTNALSIDSNGIVHIHPFSSITSGVDVFVTGGTYNNISGVATFVNNTGGTFNIVGFNTSTGNTSPTISSYTYNPLNNTFTITDSTGNTFNATFRTVSGLTVNGVLLANTVSATTYQNLPLDVYVTGGTYNSGTILFRNNTGGTFTVTNLFSGSTDVYVTGGTYNSGVILFRNNTGGTFTVTNLFSGSTDVYVTGGTYSSGVIQFRNNTGGTFSVTNLFSGSTDVFVTGGTYNNISGVATFVNNTGGTFNVVGFNTSTGNTSPTISLYTYNPLNNTFTITDSTGNTFNAQIRVVSGLTVNGVLLANTVSATTYQNLPLDVYVTGGTYNSGTILFRNNTGGTFTVTNLFSGSTDVYVTGGTYSNGAATFRNNTGGTFTLTGLYTGATDVYVTGGTYSNGVIQFRNNTGGTFSVTNLFSGSTDVFVTGGTYNSGTILFRNNTGGTFTVTNLFSGTTDVFVTGGTYNSGVILFRNNTGGTFTVTNLFSGSTDVFVTGGTYSNGTATFRNNTGGTFSVIGFSTGSSSSSTAETIYNASSTLISNRIVGLSSFTLNFSSATQSNTLVLSGGSVGVGKSNPTEKLDIAGNLRLSGAFMPKDDPGNSGDMLFSNGAGSAPYWAAISGSTYTPTISGGSNVTGITGYTTDYQIFSDWVNVWGEFQLVSTALDTYTEFIMSLPFSTSITSTYRLGGTAMGNNNRYANGMRIFYDTVTGEAKFAGISTTDSTTSLRYSFHFSYRYYPA